MSDRKHVRIVALDDDYYNALMIRLERIGVIARHIRQEVDDLDRPHRALDSATNFLLREIADAEKEQIGLTGGSE